MRSIIFRAHEMKMVVELIFIKLKFMFEYQIELQI